MAFPSFTIRDSVRHSVVDTLIVNEKIKEKFNLSNINNRGKEDAYCQFYFTESSESSEFQRCISWAGLIHAVIYYSEVGFGPASRYDVEAALSYVRLYVIEFPKSSVKFLSDVLMSFQEWGYYVFVEYNDNPERTNLYQREGDSDFFVKTNMGIGLCDRGGGLLDFFISMNCGNSYGDDDGWPHVIKKLSWRFEECLQYEGKRLPEYVVEWIKRGIPEVKSEESNLKGFNIGQEHDVSKSEINQPESDMPNHEEIEKLQNKLEKTKCKSDLDGSAIQGKDKINIIKALIRRVVDFLDNRN